MYLFLNFVRSTGSYSLTSLFYVRFVFLTLRQVDKVPCLISVYRSIVLPIQNFCISTLLFHYSFYFISHIMTTYDPILYPLFSFCKNLFYLLCSFILFLRRYLVVTISQYLIQLDIQIPNFYYIQLFLFSTEPFMNELTFYTLP